MRARPGVWLRSAIESLATAPVAGWVKRQTDEKHYRMEPVWPNRFQRKFYGPAWAK